MREVLVDEVVLDHGQHDRGGADLQERGDLAEVGVAHDHVQAAVELRIGVGLVARVDDRALQRGLEADLLLEEVGPLADLEVDRRSAPFSAPTLPAPVNTWRLTNHGSRWRTSVGEGHGPVDEVVLVRAVAVALAVGVVLVDDDLLPGVEQPRGGAHRAGEDPLPRLVGDHQLSASAHSGVEYSGWAWST